ncbi:MAG: anthrone oxygenase family protein [Pseudomonadota bacterium]
MFSDWFLIVCAVSAIACGLVSGVFLTFSDFVMRSLNGAHTPAGVEVMQIINREVYRSVFMVLLIGMAVLSPLLIVLAYIGANGPALTWMTLGGAIYLIGVFMVTIVFNVPMNKRLDKELYAAAEAARYWTSTYWPRWTSWNHVRTAGAALAAACYLIACVYLVQPV